MAQACAVLTGIEDALWAASGADLGQFMSELDELAARVDAARVEVLREAVDRVRPARGRSGAHAWLLDHSPSLRAGGSARVVRLAEAAHDDRYGALLAAVREARVPLVTATVVVDEFERLAPGSLPGGWAGARRAHRRRVVGQAQGRARPPRPAGREVRRARASSSWSRTGRASDARLSQPFADGTGLFEYTMVVDAEAKTVIEAAVQGLSAPRPAEGEPDRRPVGQRRMDALLEVVRRGVASADGVHHPQGRGVRDRLPRRPRGPVERRHGVRVGGGRRADRARRPPVASPVTPGSCPSSSARTARSSTWGAGSGCSPAPSCEPCGCATAGARSPTARCRRPGATVTTWALGRRRLHRPRQRCVVVRAAPHGRAPQGLPRGAGRRRGPVDARPRFVRPLAGWTGGRRVLAGSRRPVRCTVPERVRGRGFAPTPCGSELATTAVAPPPAPPWRP